VGRPHLGEQHYLAARMQHVPLHQRPGQVHQDLVRPGQLQEFGEDQLQQQSSVRSFALRVLSVAAVPALRGVQGSGERAAGQTALAAQSQHLLAQPGRLEQHLRQADPTLGQTQAAARGDGGESLRRLEAPPRQPAGRQRPAERAGPALRPQDRLQRHRRSYFGELSLV
jgi:hypothetical protein